MKKIIVFFLFFALSKVVLAQFPWNFHWGEISSNGTVTYQPYALDSKYENNEETMIYCKINTYIPLQDFINFYTMQRITINSVMLSLNHNINSGHYGNNASVIQRAITPLISGSIFGFPSTTTTNQIFLSQSSTPVQDYFNVNITSLFIDILHDYPNSNGFVIRTTNTLNNNKLTFTGPGPGTTYQNVPQLIIDWQWNDCAPSYAQTESQHSVIGSFSPTTSTCTSTELDAMTWTIGGAQPKWGILRSTLQFDFSQYFNDPNFISVTGAKLYLYAHPNPSNGTLVYPQYGSNGAVLQKITSPWSCNAINWFNQPSLASSRGQITIPPSRNRYESYVLDATAMVNDAIADPSQYFGFLFKLQNESIGNASRDYRSMIFANANYPDIKLKPALVICATWLSRIRNKNIIVHRTDTVYQTISNKIVEKNLDYNLYRTHDSTSKVSSSSSNNEYSDAFVAIEKSSVKLIFSKNNFVYNVSLLDAEGRLVKCFKNLVGKVHLIDIGQIPMGMYYLVISNSNIFFTRKFVKQ